MICLGDLPLEILRRICEYALPQGLEFGFQQRHTEEGSDPHRTYTLKTGGQDDFSSVIRAQEAGELTASPARAVNRVSMKALPTR